MKCQLNPNIKSISGRVGGMLFKTFNKPDGSTETRVYNLPRRKNGSYGYDRKKPLSETELKARELFTKRQAYVRHLLDAAKAENKRLSLAKAWKIAKQEIN